MPTVLTHALVGGALAPLAPRQIPRLKLTVSLCAASMLPDLDVLGFALGIPYGHPLGHRGLAHSLPFAAALGLLLPLLAFPDVPRFARAWWQLAGLVFVACASHGLLDALTDGGRGVGLLVPFHEERFFFPWRPIAVAPLEPDRFFRERGLRVLLDEMRWIWLPLGLTYALAAMARRRRGFRSRR